MYSSYCWNINFAVHIENIILSKPIVVHKGFLILVYHICLINNLFVIRYDKRLPQISHSHIIIHRTLIVNYTGISQLTRVILFIGSPDVMLHFLFKYINRHTIIQVVLSNNSIP